MKITEIKYTKRFNLGNYEHEELFASAVMDETENPLVCFESLKDVVIRSQKGDYAPTTQMSFEEISSKPEKPSAIAEDIKPKEIEEKSSAPAKEKKPRAKKVPAHVPYDRENPLHKSLVGQMLDQALGATWKSKPDKVKAASTSHIGKDFMDFEGNVVESFKKSFLEVLS